MAEQTTSKRSGRATRQPELTRAQLLEAALVELTEHGTIGLRVQRVARRANCTTGAIYTQFGDRGGLLAAALAERARRAGVAQYNLQELARLQFGLPETPDDIVFEYGMGVATTEAEALRRQILEACAAAEFSAPLMAEMREIMKGWLDEIAGYIRAAQQAGAARTDVDPRAAAIVWLGSILATGTMLTVAELDLDQSTRAEVFRAAQMAGQAFSVQHQT